jgi:hypothetical protein
MSVSGEGRRAAKSAISSIAASEISSSPRDFQ